MLDLASKTLIWIWHEEQWNLVPTFHFMTSHSVEFAKEDQTTFTAINEGVEKENYQIRLDARNTFKGGQTKYIQLLQRGVLRFMFEIDDPALLESISESSCKISFHHQYLKSLKNEC